MAAINMNIGASFMRFTFTDGEGEIFASFRINPADVKLAARFGEASKFFNDLGERMNNAATIADFEKLNDELEDKICYLLGYDAKDSLFGQISATTIMEDGNMFATHIMNVLAKNVGPEIAKRKQAMAAAVEKHTAKYQ